MSYLQAIVIAIVQGVTELFPVSSLGHSVLVPAWIGGSWETLVTQSSQKNDAGSYYLAYIVALHCATAIALLWFFRVDWVRIIAGFFRSLGRSIKRRRFSVEGSDERLAWMIVVATIPVGIVGVALESTFRTLFAKPLAASIFLAINGLILFAGELFRRRTVAARANPPAHALRSSAPGAAAAPDAAAASDAAAAPEVEAARGAERGPGHAAPAHAGARSGEEVAAAREADEHVVRLGYRNAGMIGTLQIAALCAGISRDGITMVGGLWRGLDREEAARFAFLLATPPILAAGLLKVPSLADAAAANIHGQVIVGAIVAGVCAYLSVRFLVRYFKTRSLTPFAIYCLIAGVVSAIHFA